LLQIVIGGRILLPIREKDWEHAMVNTLILSALVAAAPAITSTPGPELVINEQRNVAYEELSSGKAAEAAQSLEAAVQRDPRDPATLINLGTAYAQLDDDARAEQAFRSALTSGTRYQLELADGSWDDSRALARRALDRLERGHALAALGG
jgi:cytochrome c-type biogenesis protein CcmH/NrfG